MWFCNCQELITLNNFNRRSTSDKCFPSENQTWENHLWIATSWGIFHCHVFFSGNFIFCARLFARKILAADSTKILPARQPFASAVPNWFHAALGPMDLPGGPRGGDVTWNCGGHAYPLPKRWIINQCMIQWYTHTHTRVCVCVYVYIHMDTTAMWIYYV